MRLQVTRLDLKVEFRGTIACGHITIHHFEPQVQQAIAIIGNATFHDSLDPDINFIISTPAIDQKIKRLSLQTKGT